MLQDATQDKDPQKWVIVFLIYADFTITRMPRADNFVGLNGLFRDLIETPIHPDYSTVHVIMDSISDHKDSSGKFFRQEAISHFRISGTERSQDSDIMHCTNLYHASNKNPATKFSTSNSGIHKTEPLAVLLGKIVPDQHEKVMLVTWDHGSGFGIFRQGEEADVKGENQELIDFDEVISKPAFSYLKLFWKEAKKQFGKKKKDEEQTYAKICLGDKTYYYFDTAMEPQCMAAMQQLAGFDKRDNIITLESAGANKQQLNIDQESMSVSPVVPQLVKDAVEILADKNLILTENTSSVKLPEILTNGELAGAIDIWLRRDTGLKREVSVLLMMNCYMLNLHTMYNFSKNVECLVAAQSIMANPGYNYAHILRFINDPKNPSRYDARAVAKECVTSVSNPSWILGAMDLQKEFDSSTTILYRHIDLLRNIFGIIKANLAEGEQLAKKPGKDNALKTLIKHVRAFSLDYTLGLDVGMVDITNFIAGLRHINNFFRKNLLSKKLGKKIDAYFLAAKNESFVIGQQNLGEIYPADTIGTYLSQTPSGYGLFFKKKHDIDERITVNAKNDSLLNSVFSDWYDILEMLYK